MTNTNMFDLLDRVTDLVEEDNPDRAYRVIKDAISNDPDGRARWFLSSWVEHLISKPQKKFDEIVMVLREDYPQLGKAQGEAATGTNVEAETDTETESYEPATLEQDEAPAPATASAVMTETEPQAKPAQKRKYRRRATATTAKPSTADSEHITLTFYDWQMAAIHRAAQKQKVDESLLISQILETGNARPLAFARYKAGGSSPDQRITLPVPVGTKEKLEKAKNLEGIKTNTKYVRHLMFGNRAEKR